MKRYQSGAAKRKKAKEDKDALATLPKLTSFLTRASCPAPENSSSASGGFSPENTTSAEPGDSEVISNESTEIPDNEVETDNINQLYSSYGEEIQTMSTEQSSSHIEERASAVSDGFDVGDLQEYGFVCIGLRIFCTLPVTVASAERSFSQLKRIKSYTRSTMAQDRLQGLALLCIESDLAKTIDYDAVIDSFASKKDRKAPL